MALWGVGLFILALWMAIRPNRDIAHDGMIYTLFALARLYPSLAHDFFVLYGTQDHYTIFSPLYAAAIRLFGLDRTANLIVLFTQIGFFCAAWLLARRLTTPGKALLGLGLLVVLPSWYGANMVFSHTELFPTPRQPAEALVLLGIGFAISSRRWAAAVCLLASALLHPIIAGAGILFWIVLEVGLPHPRATLLAGVAGVTLCVLVTVIPHGPLPQFDPAWLHDLQTRLIYLFPSRWAARDWAWSIPGLALLFVGSLRAASATLRRLCLASLVTVLTGLVLAIVGADLMHVEAAAQLQMWRWLWLSGVLSSLISPVIVLDSWKSGIAGRAAALALVACWLTTEPLVVFTSAALACLSAVTLSRREPPAWREQRVLLLAACAMTALAAGFLAFDWYHMVRDMGAVPPAGSHLATRIAQFRMLTSSAPLCAITLIILWRAALSTTRRGAALLLGLGLMACIAMAPYSWATWTRIDHPPAVTASFDSWRQIIPENVEVLWPDQPPSTAWYSLHRASYWSLLQMAGMVFSRQDWKIGDRREQVLGPVLPYIGEMAGSAAARDPHLMTPQATMRSICALKDLEFFASWRDLGPTPYPILTLVQPMTGKSGLLRLYRCQHEPH